MHAYVHCPGDISPATSRGSVTIRIQGAFRSAGLSWKLDLRYRRKRMFNYKKYKPVAALMLCPLFISLHAAFAQSSLVNDERHFQFERQASLNLREVSVRRRGDVTIHDLTYASPKGGRVPAYLVVPYTKGKLAAILWGHWMMPKSPTANRSEFLDEAVALAPTGAVSLLIDTPQVRPGLKKIPIRLVLNSLRY